MNSRKITVILVLIFITGVSLLLYPTVSNWWNSKVQSSMIVDYNKMLESMDSAEYDKEFRRADEYNNNLRKLEIPLADYEQLPEYWSIVNTAGNGIIGSITIDRLNLELPVFHGTSNSVLNVAVGHLEGTSLPVGGPSTHAVLSAHRGLPSAKLFSDLDEMKEGDIFSIHVLNRTLRYEVDLIRIVEPKEIDIANIEEGKDYVTLLTCTPYGINTHRLLVRGHRIESLEENKLAIINEAYELDSLMLAPLAAAPMLLGLFILLIVKTRK